MLCASNINIYLLVYW